MTESELYKELGTLTKDKRKWQENIPYVSSLLTHESVKILAKSLWLLGEMGLEYPLLVKDSVPKIASFCDSAESLLRERAVNALGRIGRGNYSVIEPYWADLFRFATDEAPNVRLSFIWASENIATNTPDIYADYMPIFEKLLHDTVDKVQMEAPEIFRVLGKRRPEFVMPFVEQLQKMAETDENRVVRIHCSGAIKATKPKMIGLIVARSKNNVIGKNGRIPWEIDGEKQQFKELTTGNVVMMGRRTYEEIGHPLPNRQTIVVSKSKKFEGDGVDTATSFSEALAKAKGKNVYIAGGYGLYKEAIPFVDVMYITEIDIDIEGGDVFFPEFDSNDFDVTVGETLGDDIRFTRMIYRRKR